MRVVKEANERKNEILEAAAILFQKNGFEQTSIHDIQEMVGIARGTLYHHFKSKEEIMDAILKKQSEQMLLAARKIAEDKTIPIEERIIRTAMALKLEKAEGAGSKELIEQLHKPQNALMHQKTKRIIMQQVPPILAEIIKDGIDQELLDTPYPLECMELMVAYLNIMLDDEVMELTEEQQFGRLKAFIFHLERMLGVKMGQLDYILQIFEKGQEK